MRPSFHAKVHVPLQSAGFLEVVVDVPDMDRLQPDDREVVFSALETAINFAKEVALAKPKGRLPELVEPGDPGFIDDVAAGRLSPVVVDYQGGAHIQDFEEVHETLGPEKVPCPDCGRTFVPTGLGVHRARAHPGRAPSAPEPKPEPEHEVPAPRVCAEPGCETLLSAYNKRKWCALHEGQNSRTGTFGRTA